MCGNVCLIYIYLLFVASGADPGFWEGGSEHRGGSLKQGKAIGCFLFIALKSCQNARFKAYSYLFTEIQGT